MEKAQHHICAYKQISEKVNLSQLYKTALGKQPELTPAPAPTNTPNNDRDGASTTSQPSTSAVIS